MIDLYYCPTPNCQKISIALEEFGLAYRVHPIDIVAGDQNEPAFAAICPNRKVPATELGGLDGDAPARTIIEDQDQKIAEMSGNRRSRIKSLARAGKTKIKAAS